jgi:hypothetical protein
MDPSSGHPVADRHALVMAIWLTGGMVAAVFVHYGLSSGRTMPIYLAGGALLAAFIAHVIVNAAYETTFTARELALALLLYGVALLAFALAALLEPAFRSVYFQPVGVTLIVVGAVMLFYMVTHYGVRGVFESFDVVRDAGIRRRTDRLQSRWRRQR